MNELPRGWEQVPLGDVVDVLDSQRVPVNADEREKRKGSIPYYGATGQVGWIDRPLFNEELLLLGEDGAPFLDPRKPKAYMISGPSWVNNHAHVLRAIDGRTSNRYLLNYLNWLDYNGRVTGSTRLKLTQRALRSLPVRLAPVEEQQRIVDMLEEQFSRLDAGVESLHRVKRNLTRLRASILNSAVEGRLVAQDHRDESADVLLLDLGQSQERLTERGNPIRAFRQPPPFDTALAGIELPNSWRWASIGQIASLIEYGSSAKAGAGGEEAVPVLRMGNIVDGSCDFSNLKFLPKDHPDVARFKLVAGDLLFNRTNSPELVGKSAVFMAPVNMMFASYLIRVRFLPGIDSRYVAHVINSRVGRSYIARARSQQVGQANVNGTKLAALPVPIPPTAEQRRIVDEVERQFSIIDSTAETIDAELRQAGSLRRSILGEVFGGRSLAE